MGKTEQSVTAEQVSAFLRKHTDFLSQQPELLVLLELEQAPAGTISLAQRQRQQLRQKNQQLQEQLQALIENAKANTRLQQRVNRLCLSLMDCPTLPVLLQTVIEELQSKFSADEVAIRLFFTDQQVELPETNANIDQLHADDMQLKVFDHILGKQEPVCGRLTQAQKALLFGASADKVQSVACLPMGHNPCAGLLAIASYDANRFHANMGTEYLSFLGDVLMRLLRRFHEPHDQH